MKKLFVVTVEYEYMAWARDEKEAESYIDVADICEHSSINAVETDGSELAHKWDKHCILYHEELYSEDFSVQDALDILDARKPDPNQLDLVKLIEDRANRNTGEFSEVREMETSRGTKEYVCVPF